MRILGAFFGGIVICMIIGIVYLRFIPIKLTKQDCKLPTREQIAKGDPMPIDGIWEYREGIGSVNMSIAKIRIEGGRVLIWDAPFIRTGAVVIKDLKRLDDTRYGGTLLYPERDDEENEDSNVTIREKPTVLEVISPNEIVQEVQREDDPSKYVAIRYSRVSLDDERSFLAMHGDRGQRDDIRLSGVELVNIKENRILARSEEQQISPGVQLSFERARTIEHNVSLESNVVSNGGVSSHLLSLLQIEVRAQMEEKQGRNFKESETYKTTVTLDGNRSRKWILSWFDKIRTGIAQYKDTNGNIQNIPFRFPESTEMIVNSVK